MTVAALPSPALCPAPDPELFIPEIKKPAPVCAFHMSCLYVSYYVHTNISGTVLSIVVSLKEKEQKGRGVQDLCLGKANVGENPKCVVFDLSF